MSARQFHSSRGPKRDEESAPPFFLAPLSQRGNRRFLIDRQATAPLRSCRQCRFDRGLLDLRTQRRDEHALQEKGVAIQPPLKRIEFGLGVNCTLGFCQQFSNQFDVTL